MIWYHTPVRNGMLGPRCFHGKLFTHLMADDEAELVRFAVRELGMKRQWLQDSGTARAHFDVVGSRLDKAQRHPGAMEISRKEYVQRMRARLRLEQ
jgi:hypothetical protein